LSSCGFHADLIILLVIEQLRLACRLIIILLIIEQLRLPCHTFYYTAHH
jgi:hypothetical protein